jgi:hypothetical protein
MKITILNDNLEFIPENDIDVYNLAKINFNECLIEFSPDNKMIKLNVTVNNLLDKLFENKNNLYD